MKKFKTLIKGDPVIWVIFFFLTLISLVAVYSSIGLSAIEVSHSTPLRQFVKHAAFVVGSYAFVVLVSNVNYRRFSRISQIGYYISVALLGVMLALHMGRWMFGFQPSEIAKIVLIVYMARQIAVNKDHVKEWITFRNLMLVMIVVAVLILPENFSTAALVCVICILMMFYGGINSRYLGYTVVVVVAVAVIGLLVAYSSYHRKVAEMELAKASIERVDDTKDGPLPRLITWGHRIDSWWNPDKDALTQENMARMAVARGEVFGQGIGSTIHARLMTQAHNDFIFAIIIEETGLCMGIFIFILYTVLFLRCIQIAGRCRGLFGSLTVAGLGSLIYVQALVNMCVAVGVLPVTGQTLPLISYGGTAYLCMGISIGIIQSIAHDTRMTEKAEKEKAERERGFEELYQMAAEEKKQ